jgi:predicted nucleic acid-binding protein
MPRSVLHVFIDTNVLLNFYSFTQDDLEELRKLRVAVENGEIRLWTTTQAADELARNRENKIAEAMRALKDIKVPSKVPAVARNLPEFEELMEARREYDRHLNALQQQLAQQFKDGHLVADQVLEELGYVAQVIAVSEDIRAAAMRRVETGNPPGKDGVGDAVNWECLLAECPDGEDLYLVTEDADFISPLDSDRIAAVLADEWSEKKQSHVGLYRRISSLFQDHFPQIRLASELEKQFRIRRLRRSGSFEETHRAIAGLAEYDEFTDQEARELLEAAVWNSQVNWISRDQDVLEFYTDLLNDHRDSFEEDELERFTEVFAA